jgi:pimeloyl-ACP methyl ester carboxylesterase
VGEFPKVSRSGQDEFLAPNIENKAIYIMPDPAHSSDISPKTPLFLIPGWGTDHRIWHNQLEADLGPVEPIVPEWLVPESRNESLAGYAKRLAESIDPGRPCYLAGLSFGGMVAMEMAQHLDVRACILIASIASGTRLPRRYHIFRPLIRFIPAAMWYAPRAIMKLHRALRGKHFSENRQLIYQLFFDAPISFFHWTAQAILRWRGPENPTSCPLHVIHGDRDQVLPIRYAEPDVVLSGAGHCLPITWPEEVNEFIAQVVTESSGESR